MPSLLKLVIRFAGLPSIGLHPDVSNAISRTSVEQCFGVWRPFQRPVVQRQKVVIESLDNRTIFERGHRNSPAIFPGKK